MPLIQNRFVLYWADDSLNASVSYVASSSHIYNIFRSGMIVSFINDIFPDAPASNIIKNALLYGHLRVSDYMSAQNSLESRDTAKAMSYLVVLIRRNLLQKLESHEFYPDSDIYAQIFKRRLNSIARSKAVSESKREATARSEAATEFDKLKCNNHQTEGLLISSKTPTQSKLFNSSQNGNQLENVLKADEHAVLAVNYNKFLVLFRNREFTNLALSRVGPVSAAVYKQLLHCMEPQMHSCKESSGKLPIIFIRCSLAKITHFIYYSDRCVVVRSHQELGRVH